MDNITPNNVEKKPEPVKPAEPAGIVEVTLADFKKLDIRVARIVEAMIHPEADKLLLIKVDLGGKTKQVVAGIREYYKCEDLAGRLVIVIDNLKPATLR